MQYKKIIFLTVLLPFILLASAYPMLYDSLGKRLFDADVKLERLKSIPNLTDKIYRYQIKSRSLFHHGLQLESGLHLTSNESKEYLRLLRDLEQDYNSIIRSLRSELLQSIEYKDYERFKTISNSEIDGLLNSKMLQMKVIMFYRSNRHLGNIPSLERAVERSTQVNKKHQVYDVTKNVEYIGNPYHSLYSSGELIYARNIWDMHSFNGLLFVGAGNSANTPPAPNAGRVPVWSYDPLTSKFTNEGKVAEEQIDRFRTINNELYIPGHDATQKWTFGNFYKRTKNHTWKQYRNIENALHVYDIAATNNKLFVALGLYSQSAVGISTDQGGSWAIKALGNSYSRTYSFLKVNNKLYACKSFTPLSIRQKWPIEKRKDYYSIAEYSDSHNFRSRPDLIPSVMFPSTRLNRTKSKKIIRTEEVDSKAIYLGAYTHNDHDSLPFGVYIASSLEKGNIDIHKVDLPQDYTPWDILIKKEKIYILCYDSFRSQVIVMSSQRSSLKEWVELFHFKSSTFARSFELLNEDFYFGLGTMIQNKNNWSQSDLDRATGNIIRVKRKYIR